MRVALLNDTHFGARNDSHAFLEYFFKFYDNIFFPYLEKHGIDTVIHLGDIVDSRKFINYTILNRFKTDLVFKLKRWELTSMLLLETMMYLIEIQIK
mgnify:CR=1 FL=1